MRVAVTVRTVPIWRAALWGTLAALFFLPLLAMQVTREVSWTSSDFVAGGLVLMTAGLGLEFALRLPGGRVSRAIASAAVVLAAALIWADGAVQVF